MGKNKDMDLLTEIGRVPRVYKGIKFQISEPGTFHILSPRPTHLQTLTHKTRKKHYPTQVEKSLVEFTMAPFDQKAEITRQLVILNNRIARDSAQVPKLTTVISEVNEPYCDPAFDKEPVLLAHGEVRNKRVEGTIQLLAQTERALREYQAKYKRLEAELRQLEQNQT